MQNHTDTIVAIATPPGRGGVSVIRVSGKKAKNISEQLIKKNLRTRFATFCHFLAEDNSVIDSGLAIFFSNPHSFTGEDILELQGHGSPIVADMLIQRILSLGARLARPGEFSERAFLNHKIDLAQAEAIADLIDAASTQAARSAVRSLQGEFSKKIQTLVEALIHLRMYVEAAIDFAEEEIDFLADDQVKNKLETILIQLEETEASAVQGSLLREGIYVVIAGEPNVGKSSLLNCLSGKESAIVTDIPGTTRDLLREYISIDGMPIHVIDTAGLRDSHDKVEQEGIRRAHAEIARADIILHVVDASVENIKNIPSPENIPVIIVRNKIDLTQEQPSVKTNNDVSIISLSAKQPLGLDLLKQQIKKCVGFKEQTEGCFSARRRHLDALAKAKSFLLEGSHQLKAHRAGELLAEDLRQAQLSLSEITGEFTTDDLLGRIFSSFCVGK